MNIVLCYPAQPRHIDEIAAILPKASITVAQQSEIAEQIFEADIFCGHAKVPIDWKQVVNQGRLAWIQSSAAGLDHCLAPEVIESKIVVSSASGMFAGPVAEQTMALLLGLLRRLPRFIRAGLERQFERQPTDDLQGKTVGIVGFGGNGQQIARVLQPFDVRLIAVDWFPESSAIGVDEILPVGELDRLLSQADILILTVPLTPQTCHLISRREFELMQPGSYVINVARGAVIDELALVSALESGHLAGAGLDVTEVEPLPVDSRLWDFPNVIITPHVGAQSATRIDRMTSLFCCNLERWTSQQTLLNLVDKSLGFPRPEHRVDVNTNSELFGANFLPDS